MDYGESHIKRPELVGRHIDKDGNDFVFRINKMSDDQFIVSIEGIPREMMTALAANPALQAQCRMQTCYFNLTGEQYHHFETSVLDKPIEWIITIQRPWYARNETVTIPGRWTHKLMDGGRRKRSGRKRSGRKRSGRKRSGRKRTATRRSRN
jgi:hypothetical protein